MKALVLKRSEMPIKINLFQNETRASLAGNVGTPVCVLLRDTCFDG